MVESFDKKAQSGNVGRFIVMAIAPTPEKAIKIASDLRAQTLATL